MSITLFAAPVINRGVLNGSIAVEIAVKRVIENRPVSNKDALINPKALEFYTNVKNCMRSDP